MGQYHTIELETSRPVQIEKEYCWDFIFLDRVKEACDPGANADLAAVVMHEGGHCPVSHCSVYACDRGVMSRQAWLMSVC